MEPNLNSEINQSGFDEFDKELSFVDADKTSRFINYVVDAIIIYIVFLALAFVIGIVGTIISPDTFTSLDTEGSSFELMMYLLFFVVYFLYYSVMESTLGRTVGKFATKTKVIDEDTNVKPTFTMAFIRTLCRLIPFDAISFFFYDAGGWHDRIPKVRVVKN